VDLIRRWLTPPVATAVIALIVGAQVAVVLAFTLSYVERGRRITELQAALCEERVGRLSRIAMPDTACPDADKILARVLPQRSTPIARSGSTRVAARIVEWRPPPAATLTRGR
jgi:hypothetical protein